MASTTLTWRRTTAAKTGTTDAALFTDMASAVNAVLADANYKWQVASEQHVTSPYYIVLKRKDGSAGRILIADWQSAPAGNNTAILDQAPTTTAAYIMYFPSGNVDTPSNLTAASGTIMGVDTGCTKACSFGGVSTFYAALFVVSVWDSEEAVWFSFQNPASTPVYMCAAGLIFLDLLDNSVSGNFAMSTSDATTMGSSSPSPGYNSGGAIPSAGSNGNQAPRAYLNSVQRAFFTAYARASGWAVETTLANNLFLDSANSKAYFDSIPLACYTKGLGVPIKLRQVGLGPPMTGALQTYNTSLLTPAALCPSTYTGGQSQGFPWLLNFKL